jgi:uncharacterized protein YycO
MRALRPLLFILLTSLCSQSALASATSCEQRGDTHNLSQEMAAFQEQVEQALYYRSVTIDVAQRLKAQMDADQPLNGDDLHILNQGTVDHLALRDSLYEFARLHACWLTSPEDELPDAARQPDEKLAAVMLSLSAALVLYDNYLLAISVFEQDTRLRKLLNKQDTGYNKARAQLAAVTNQYNSVSNRARVRAGIHYYEKQIQKASPEFLAQDDIAWLQMLIDQSPSYAKTRRFSPLYVLGHDLEYLGAMTSDTLAGLRDEGVNLFSSLFGNATGLVETRRGKLYGRDDISLDVKSHLRAGDILLEKTPFRLTDKFIPGHWGHAAIWVGTADELKALGIWDHPVVVPYQADIQSGNGIVEALRNGVVMNPVDHFLNIDDLAVLRHGTRDPVATSEVIIQSLRQVGKSYDFNFNVETTDRIVCSELVYLAYTDIQWPTVKAMGRATISPDNIAEKALQNGPLELALIYHDGQPVTEKQTDTLAQLMGRPE